MTYRGLSVASYLGFLTRFCCDFEGLSQFRALICLASLAAAATTMPASTPAPRTRRTGSILPVVSRFGGFNQLWNGRAHAGRWRLCFFRRPAIARPAIRAFFLSWSLAALAFLLPAAAILMPDFARRLVGAAGRGLFQLVGLFRVLELHEVGYIKEGVALQTKVNKR